MRLTNDASARPPRQVRPRALTVLTCIVLLAGAGLASRPANALPGAGGGGPRLVVLTPEVDLGELPKGATAEARFELKNEGDSDLEIRSAESGCGCTVATFDRVIAPGAVGVLTATLTTGSLDGEVVKAIKLDTNERRVPTPYVVIRATVVSAVRILPEERIVLRDFLQNGPVLRLIRRGQASGIGYFNIVGLRASESWMRARASKVREDRPADDELPAARAGDWILELSLNDDAPKGRSEQQVQFKTGLEKQPTVSLPVFVEVRAAD